MALYWPVDAGISQQFASNPSSIQPKGHTGIDFKVALNTPIKAAGAGKVVFANWATTLSASNPWWIAPAYAGITVVIDHGNGLLTLYAHLNKTDLNAGDSVSQGQVIGLSGSTGLSTGPHLHFEVIGWPISPYNGFYGRLNPNNYVSSFIQVSSSTPTKANQRKVGPDNVNHRAQSNSAAKVLRIIPANSLEEFTGFVHSESVKGNDLWYQDATGFAWSGGFTTQSTAGLIDITPKKPTLKVNQRTVGADNVNHRTQSNSNATVLRVIPANSVEEFQGFVHGENVKGIDIWFQDSKGFAWAGGFTSQSTAGLVDITPKAPIVPTPPAVVDPLYAFTKDFDFVEYEPADKTNVQQAKDNPGVVVFPPKPTHVVLHQFDAKEKNPSIDGAIDHFQTIRPNEESSAHFLVSGTRIIQAVSLKDRAYHAGPVGNNYIGIEVDPDEDAATVASVKKLLAAIKAKYGYLPIYTRHRDVPGNATLCGADIHLELYSLTEPVTPPVTQPPVVVPPTVPTTVSEREAVQDFVDWVVDMYFKQK